MTAVDLKKLNTLDRCIVGGGAVAFVAAFLPWWGYSGPLNLYGSSLIGWNAGFTAWLGSLLLTAAGLHLLLRRSGFSVPGLPFGPAVTVAAASAAGVALVALRWVTLPRLHAGIAGSVSPRFGIWVALIAGGVQLAAAVLEFRSSGEKVPWSKPAGATPSGG